MRVVIGAGAVGATLRNGFGAFHHEGAAGFAVSFEIAFSAGGLCFDRVFAIGIVGTAVEGAEATAFFDHLALVAEGALHTGCLRLRSFDEFAFGIIAAGDESAEATDLFDEGAAALGTWLAGFFALGDERAVFHAGAFTIGEARATQEGSVFAELHGHSASADGAGEFFGRVADIGDLVHVRF